MSSSLNVALAYEYVEWAQVKSTAGRPILPDQTPPDKLVMVRHDWTLGGLPVKSVGDGFLARFDRPEQAIRCATSITEGVRGLGIQVRAGVHTGEIETDGDDIHGIGVHIGARVAALAGPSEVLVTKTVAELVTGSGVRFVDRGEHELKGVPGRWTLLAVVD
jgi:class 3 adenylate cyclase